MAEVTDRRRARHADASFQNSKLEEEHGDTAMPPARSAAGVGRDRMTLSRDQREAFIDR